VLDPGDRVTFAVQDGPKGPIAEEVRVTEGAAAAKAPATDRLVVPLHEEELSAITRDVRLGDVLIHKRVETVPVETTIDLAHDEVSIERVPVNRPVDAVPEARYEGDALVVPIVAEELVTTKRLVVREDLRITRRRVTEAHDSRQYRRVPLDDCATLRENARDASAQPTFDDGTTSRLHDDVVWFNQIIQRDHDRAVPCGEGALNRCELAADALDAKQKFLFLFRNLGNFVLHFFRFLRSS